MEILFRGMAEYLTGWDFLIAGLIVLFVEYIIKGLFFKGKEVPQAVMKLSPIVLGAVVYVVISIIEKSTWYISLAHGLLVGLAAMGFYDVILKTMKDSAVKSINDANEAVKKAIEGK